MQRTSRDDVRCDGFESGAGRDGNLRALFEAWAETHFIRAPALMTDTS